EVVPAPVGGRSRSHPRVRGARARRRALRSRMGRGGNGMTGIVVWFTGLPSSGKSTLAAAVAGELRLRGTLAVTLDSDDLRDAITPPLGYDDASRAALYGTLARLAAMIARQGHVVLVPATAHRRAFREEARALAPAFLEIFVDTPIEECM